VGYNCTCAIGSWDDGLYRAATSIHGSSYLLLLTFVPLDKDRKMKGFVAIADGNWTRVKKYLSADVREVIVL